MKLKFKQTNYPSDLTDEQWESIRKFVHVGNKSKHHKRNLVNGVLYEIHTECPWRSLPREYPPYSTVYNFYSRAKKQGTWDKIIDTLNKLKQNQINNINFDSENKN